MVNSNEPHSLYDLRLSSPVVYKTLQPKASIYRFQRNTDRQLVVGFA